MDKHKVAEYSAHYQSLDEWVIADLHARSSSLTEEARIALDAVITDRGINLEKIHREVAKEELDYVVKERAREEERKKREDRASKIWIRISLFLIIFIVILYPPDFLGGVLMLLTFLFLARYDMQSIWRYLIQRKRHGRVNR